MLACNFSIGPEEAQLEGRWTPWLIRAAARTIFSAARNSPSALTMLVFVNASFTLIILNANQAAWLSGGLLKQSPPNAEVGYCGAIPRFSRPVPRRSALLLQPGRKRKARGRRLGRMSWVREFPVKDPVVLVVHLSEFVPGREPRPLVEEAVHNYFAYRARLNRLEFRRLMKEGRQSLAIGAERFSGIHFDPTASLQSAWSGGPGRAVGNACQPIRAGQR